jgi:hypothetical protein
MKLCISIRISKGFLVPESKFAMHKNNENRKDIAAKKFLCRR